LRPRQKGPGSFAIVRGDATAFIFQQIGRLMKAKGGSEGFRVRAGTSLAECHKPDM